MRQTASVVSTLYPSLTPMKSPSYRSARRHAGFTLIELLTVIAIIGILAAIIIPTVGSVREKAKQAHCSSRLRQWASAVNLYAADNKGYYWVTLDTGYEPWCVDLSANSGTNNTQNPYSRYFNTPSGGLDDWIYCPSRLDAKDLSDINTPAKTGYVMIWPTLRGSKAPAIVNGSRREVRIPLSKATAPSRTILMIDRFYSTSNGTLTAGATGTGASFSVDDASNLNVYRNFDRHGGSANTAFLDGSVRRMKWYSGDANTSLAAGSSPLSSFNTEWFKLDL